MNGYQALPRVLSALGCSQVFAMVGGTNVPWLAEGVHASLLRLIRTRHEGTAVAAAMGYAQSTGMVGVCTVTKGPGFTNAITALISAVRHHVPIVLIVSESPSRVAVNAQDIDQRALTTVSGAGYLYVDAEVGLAAGLAQAFAVAAATGQPQVVEIAESGVFDALYDDLTTAAPPTPAVPDAGAVAAAVDLLRDARNPLIIAGRGAVVADAHDELVRLADTVGARVATTLPANGFFAGHPSNVGFSGNWATGPARFELRTSDLVVAFGAAMNDYTRGMPMSLYQGARLVHVDTDPRALGRFTDPTVGIVADARLTASAMLDEWERRDIGARTATPLSDWTARVRGSLEVPGTAMDDGALDPRAVFAELDARLPTDRYIVTDGGRCMPPAASLIAVPGHEHYVVTNGYGSIGLGLGAAVGVAAVPGRRTVLIAGDGGFMMSIHDLDAVRLGELDLTIVIMNDGQYGAEVKYLRPHDLPLDVIQQETPDLVELARLHGGDGVRVRTMDELRAVDLDLPGLRLIDVAISRETDFRGIIGQAAEEHLATEGHP